MQVPICEENVTCGSSICQSVVSQTVCKETHQPLLRNPVMFLAKTM